MTTERRPPPSRLLWPGPIRVGANEDGGLWADVRDLRLHLAHQPFGVGSSRSELDEAAGSICDRLGPVGSVADPDDERAFENDDVLGAEMVMGGAVGLEVAGVADSKVVRSVVDLPGRCSSVGPL